MFDDKLEEVQSFALRYIKTFAMDLVVVLVALAYVFYQMVTLKQTDLNPLVLIAQAIMGIICGVVIKQALGENGFSKGYNSKHWSEEEKMYNDVCTKAVPYMDRADNFYEYEIIDRKKNFRRQHLQSKCLRYDDWFDKDGNYIGYPLKELKSRGFDIKQRKVIKKCIKVKIYPLNLFGQYTISVDQDTKKEPTVKMQRVKNTTSNTVTATIIAIIGVYFVPQITGWNWASLISATMQVALWVIFGIIQLYINYNFVDQDLVAVLRKKKEEIKRFVSGCDKGLYTHSPYEEKPIDEPVEQPKPQTNNFIPPQAEVVNV